MSTRRRGLVSWPLYRVLALLALVPPLAAALTVLEPATPAPPARPLAFSASGAAAAIARLPPPAQRTPGSLGDIGAADRVARLFAADGLEVRRDPFAADVPWRPEPVPMENVTGFRRGRSHEVVAVVAHRDTGGRRRADDTGGTGIMLELARELGAGPAQRGLLFASTDGGSAGAQGAARLRRSLPRSERLVATIVLDVERGAPYGGVDLVTRPDTPRGTSPTLYAAARAAVSQWAGAPPRLPGIYDQVSGYGIPYAADEQGPLLARDVPALTLAASYEGNPFAGPDRARVAAIGTATANLVESLETAPAVDPGGGPVVLLSGEIVRGWLVELTMVALLAPFLAGVLDLTARCRRRHLALGDAARALLWRLGAWAAALATAWALTVLPGRLLPGVAIAPQPGRTGVTTEGVLLVALAGLLFWRFLGRPRTGRVGAVGAAERTAGLAVALMALAAAAVLVAAVNPFALVVLLPACHAWLWLPAAARGGRRLLAAVYALGWLGPAALLAELWSGQGLGSQAPRAVLASVSSGYLSPALTLCFALAGAAAAQLGALVLDRYAPAHPPRPGQRV